MYVFTLYICAWVATGMDISSECGYFLQVVPMFHRWGRAVSMCKAFVVRLLAFYVAFGTMVVIYSV